MSALRAPLAVSVEIRVPDERGRRAFRLTAAAGEDGLRLETPAPFDVGRPVEVAFRLPDDPEPFALRAVIELGEDDGEGEHGGSELAFEGAGAEARARLNRYVADRLGLPPLA